MFGKSFRGANKPNLVNSINEAGTVVELEFSSSGRRYKVIRGIKPGIFEIYENDILIDQSSKAKDYQRFFEQNILKMNFKSFTQIVVLGSANYVPFMKLSAADRRDVIEDLLDIQIFSKMRNVLKEFITDTKTSINEYTNSIVMIDDKIELQKSHIEKIEKKREEDVGSKKEALEANQKEIQELLDAVQEIQTEIADLMKTISDKQDTSKARSQLNTFISQIESKINSSRKTEEFYSKGSCPTCQQDIDVEFAKAIINDNLSKVDKWKSNISEIEKELAKQDKRTEEIGVVETKIRSLQSFAAERNGRVGILQRHIKTLEGEISKSADIEDDTDSKENLAKFIEEREKKKTELSELESELSRLKMAESMLKDSGIKSKIIKEYLPIINQLINKYLNALDFFVNFTLDENFKETVKSRHRDIFSYENFSEGQKFRINISILLAWRELAKLKNSANTNLLILDEVFDSSLDAEGADAFIKLLDIISSDKTHVIVISHRGDNLTDKFDRLFQATLKNDFSYVEEITGINSGV